MIEETNVDDDLPALEGEGEEANDMEKVD